MKILITEKEINEDYVDQATAAAMLNISRSRISQLCNQGRFQNAIKVSWSWIIPKSSIEKFTPRPRGRKRQIRLCPNSVIIANALAENDKWKEITTS